MNTTMQSTKQSIYPALRYNDANRAIAWLKTVLGFEEQEVCRTDDGTVAHAELRIAGNLIMLGTGPNVDPAGVYIALESPAEVDARYARAKKAGAEIDRAICDTDYGSHEFSVRDPEGHRWSFGTYRPQAT